MAFLKKENKVKFEGGGLVLFDEVQHAMLAEKALKSAGYIVRLVAPPPELRKGCDLAVEINLVEQPGNLKTHYPLIIEPYSNCGVYENMRMGV